jgi:hypothetical protein
MDPSILTLANAPFMKPMIIGIQITIPHHHSPYCTPILLIETSCCGSQVLTWSFFIAVLAISVKELVDAIAADAST